MALRPVGIWPDSAFNRQSNTVLSSLQWCVDKGFIYQHQADAVRALKDELEHQPEGHEDLQNVSLAILPTGTGKTGVGILAAYACNARKVLVITPSETISKQQLTQFTYVHNKSLNPLDSSPFLEQRGIFEKSLKEQWAPIRHKCVLKTSELEEAKTCELVIANAHKFGEKTKGVNLEGFDSSHFSLVIVDEAHHYPAATWERIVKHFKTRIIFLTATPYHQSKPGPNKYILNDKPACYEYNRKDAVKDGYIRETDFVEVGEVNSLGPLMDVSTKNAIRKKQIHAVLQCMQEKLQQHDRDDPYTHKGMVLAASTKEANEIVDLWNEQIRHGQCASFIQAVPTDVLKQFQDPKGEVTVLVVIYRLTEGFDCKNVSVVAILRNVSKTSRVYFAQFVGRAVRKLHENDPVKATVISHVVHNQKYNYDTFEKQADEDPEDPPEEEMTL